MMKFGKLFVLLLVLTCLFMLTPPSRAETTTHNFIATADTCIVGDSADANYGNSTTLYVDGSVDAYALLFFDLSSIAGHTVIHANLTFQISTQAATSVIMISAANSSWSEMTVTYNTRPGIYSTPNTTGSTAVGNFTANITLIVVSWMNGLISNYGLVISPLTGYINIRSREFTGSLKPTLIVVSEPSEPESSIPSFGMLWIISILLTIACIYYLSQRVQLYQRKVSYLS